MKPTIAYLVISIILLGTSCTSSKNSTEATSNNFADSVRKNLTDAGAQYKVMMAKLPPGRFPKTYYAAKDSMETSGSDWWCSGFYPGTLLYLYEQTKDQSLYAEAERILKILEKEKHNTTTHDLGFMMFCSFGNALRLEPKPGYKEILLTSAKSLSTRFNPKVGCIKSWDSKPSDFLVIIDNMMNLELLFWATRESGDSSFHKIAVTHANTTMQHHFRPDFSSYHVINYDAQTGGIKEKKTAQGYSNESAWARGQAWGFYGYVVMYRETRDEKYLEHAKKIASFLLSHPNLPADKIPYWDFNAPDIHNALRDASAGAIIASALLELSTYTKNAEKETYWKSAEDILKSLSSPQYKALPGTNGGFILLHGVGHRPAGTEVDVPLTYGDYYFVEALKRYKELSSK